MITPSSIQEIRDRADILDVVGHFITLKRRGTNYIANCPFHNEKTPSFNVNPSRGIFKCFGCGKAGDVVTFVQEHEKFSFVEAIRWLAEYYNIALEETQDSTQGVANRQIEESLRILFEFAVSYFENNLFHTEEGQNIGLSYFAERGFTKSTIEKFRLGYALESWEAFYQHALKNGYTEEMLLHSGLVSRKGEKIYDTYRGRVMFPIASSTGKIVGLGARILGSHTKAPKYINSPESEVYNKSKILYGLYQSRSAIARLDECILVEGYTDVISLHQYGIENVVASSGTSLTEGQLRLIKNLTKNLVILYDGDKAGVNAATRGMQMALGESYNISVIQLPESADPDSFVQQHGAAAFRQYILDHKKDVVDFLIDQAGAMDHLTPQSKSELSNQLAETISRIHKAEDFVLQQEYIKKAAQRLSINEQGLAQLVHKNVQENIRKEQKNWIDQSSSEIPDTLQEQHAEINPGPQSDLSSPGQADKAEWKVAQVVLKYGDKPYTEDMTVAQYFFSYYDLSSIGNNICRDILNEYEAALLRQEAADKILIQFIRHTDPHIKNKAIELLLDTEQPNEKWKTEVGISIPTPEENYLEETKSSFAYFELHILGKLIGQLMEEMKDKTLSQEEIAELLKVLQELKTKERSLLSLAVRTF